MEKKRRARINDSLEALKQILLESKSTLKESTSNKKSGQRTAKLEKADILEMTVTYLQHLHNRLAQVAPSIRLQKREVAIRPADSSCERVKIGVTLVPTRLENGEIAFVVPSSVSTETTLQTNNCQSRSVKTETEHVWRPW